MESIKSMSIAKFIFPYSLLTLALMAFREMSVANLSMIPAIIFTVFSGVSLGCAISFGGLVFSRKYQKIFRGVLIIQFAVYLIMNLVAAASVGIMNNGVITIDYSGFAAVVAIILLLIMLLIRLPKVWNLSFLIAVAVLNIFLIVWIAVHSDSGILSICATSLQNLLIVLVSVYAAECNREVRSEN